MLELSIYLESASFITHIKKIYGHLFRQEFEQNSDHIDDWVQFLSSYLSYLDRYNMGIGPR